MWTYCRRNTKNEYTDATGVHNYDTGKTVLTSSTFQIVVETDMSICNTHRAALFYYNADLGYLMHHCSGRPVGPTAISTAGYMVIFQSTSKYIPDINYYWTALRRDFYEYIKLFYRDDFFRWFFLSSQSRWLK